MITPDELEPVPEGQQTVWQRTQAERKAAQEAEAATLTENGTQQTDSREQARKRMHEALEHLQHAAGALHRALDAVENQAAERTDRQRGAERES